MTDMAPLNKQSAHMNALNKRSAKVRAAQAELRRELGRGDLTFHDALYDLRAYRIPLYRVTGSMRGWGDTKVERLCRTVGVSPGRPVGHLTDRERDRLVEAHDEMHVDYRRTAA
jgi:hypothetical protein